MQAPSPVQKGIGGRWRPVAQGVAPLAVGAVLAWWPVPQGLTPNAWHYFALFSAVIVGVIAEPIPAAAVGLAGVVLGAVLRLVRPSTADATAWALSGFANSTVWLIFAAYMFALGYQKTGLGKRIALLLIRTFGKRTLGLGYAIALTDLTLAPFMPSNTARSGGTIYPVICDIPKLYGSYPNDTSARKIGAYLMYTALAVTCVTSSMFLTALSPNVLAADLIFRTIHVKISWINWFQGIAPVGIALFLIVPILLYKIFPPEIKEAPDAPRWAGAELRMIGPITQAEVTLLALVTVALVLWIAGARYIDATMAAIMVVVLMLILRVVSWKEILGNTQAWDVLVWFATLVTLANGLAETKFLDWVAQAVAPGISGRTAGISIVLVVGAFFFLHYFFASITAHVSALLPLFLSVAVKIPGVSPAAWALLLSYTLGLMGILTPYGAGPSPIYYRCGYLQGRDFWVLGVILGLVFFIVYVVIGVPWIRFLKI
jgi:L-tartrate/succinate antiporter